MDLNSTGNAASLFRIYRARNVTYALQLARESPLQANLGVILQALQYGLTLDEAWADVRELLLHLAPRIRYSREVGLWSSILQAGVEQSRRQADAEAEMILSHYLGRLLQRMARFDEAIDRFRRAEALAHELQDRAWLARSLHRIAYTLRYQKRLDEAEEALAQARTFIPEDDLEEMGFRHVVLGAIRMDQHRNQEAYESFRRALGYWRIEDDQRHFARALVNLGLAAGKLNRIVESEAALRRAIDILDALDEPESLAVAYLNLGMLLSDNGRPDEALTALSQAERLFRDMQDQFRLAMTAINLGRAYYALDRWNDAIHAFEFGIELCRELGRDDKILNASVGLAAACLRGGQVARARAIVQEKMMELDGVMTEEQRMFLEDMYAQVLKMIENAESG